MMARNKIKQIFKRFWKEIKNNKIQFIFIILYITIVLSIIFPERPTNIYITIQEIYSNIGEVKLEDTDLFWNEGRLGVVLMGTYELKESDLQYLMLVNDSKQYWHFFIQMRVGSKEVSLPITSDPNENRLKFLSMKLGIPDYSIQAEKIILKDQLSKSINFFQVTFDTYRIPTSPSRFQLSLTFDYNSMPNEFNMSIGFIYPQENNVHTLNKTFDAYFPYDYEPSGNPEPYSCVTINRPLELENNSIYQIRFENFDEKELSIRMKKIEKFRKEVLLGLLGITNLFWVAIAKLWKELFQKKNS